MLRITIEGASLKIADTVQNEVVLSLPARDIWYYEEQLKQGQIELFDENTAKVKPVSVFKEPLTSCVSEANIPFTESSFRDFAYNNLGFNPTVVASNFASRILGLSGGEIIENNC